MLGWTLPWALSGLGLVLPLAAVYFFRRRSRAVEVSSLLFWQDDVSAGQGGRRLERFRSERSFVMEALLLCLLSLAAAGPLWVTERERVVVAVVLDDSLSMRAEGVMERARLALAEATAGADEVVAVLCRDEPRLVDTGRASWEDAWTGAWPDADLASGLELARGTAPPGTPVLVLSDRGPGGVDGALDATPGVRWEGVGQARPNVALTDAVRSKGRVALEVSNFADDAASVRVTKTERLGDGEPTVRAIDLELAGGGRERVVLPVGDDAAVVELGLPRDALADDNLVVLAPPDTRLVRVRVAVGDEALRRSLERAVGASQRGRVVDRGAELLFTDRRDEIGWSGARAAVLFEVSEGGGGLLGPFTLDRTHPLSTGLDLTGMIWPAALDDGDAAFAGRPIVMADRRVLVGEETGGAVVVRLGRGGNVLEHPVLPVLAWNAIDLAAEGRPGPTVRNVPVGAAVRVRAGLDAAGSSAARIERPGGGKSGLDVVDGETVFFAAEPGLYGVTAADDGPTVVVGASFVRHGESDLRGTETVSAGSWEERSLSSTDGRSLRWLPLLVAGGLLAWHGAAVLAAPAGHRAASGLGAGGRS